MFKKCENLIFFLQFSCLVPILLNKVWKYELIPGYCLMQAVAKMTILSTIIIYC